MADTELRARNLVFLLAAAPLGMGCPVTIDIIDGDDEVGDTEADGTETGTDDEVGTETGTTDETTDTSDTTDETTDTSDTTDETDTSDTTDETTDGTDTSDTTDSTTGEGNACEPYAATLADCFMLGADEEAAYYEQCDVYLDMFHQASEACGLAFEEVLACITELPCGGDQRGRHRAGLRTRARRLPGGLRVVDADLRRVRLIQSSSIESANRAV